MNLGEAVMVILCFCVAAFAFAWVTILPMIGILYMMGYLR